MHNFVAMDAHCHLDLFKEPRAVAVRAEERGVGVVAVTNIPRVFEKNRKIFSGVSGVLVGLGLHPELAATPEADLSLFETLLPRTVVVGEIGLDARPQAYKSLDRQRDVFEQILRACKGREKILSLHSPRAVNEVLDSLERYVPEEDTVKILHWFTGTRAQARRAVDLGCYFSVNAAMVNKGRDHALLGSIPVERMLVETDGPFLASRGKPAEPTAVLETDFALAQFLQWEKFALRDQLLATANKIFARCS